MNKKTVVLLWFLGLIAFSSSVLATPIDFFYNDPLQEELKLDIYAIKSIFNDTDISRIIITDKIINNKFCGYYYYSGKIILSTAKECDLINILIHELRHVRFIQMDYKARLQYCNDWFFNSFNDKCMEHYADNYQYQRIPLS